MRLNLKIAVLIMALFASFGFATRIVERTVIMPSFVALEEDAASTNMERAIGALQRELDQLQTFSADRGNWEECYEFMAGQNPGFPDEINPYSLDSNRVDFVAFVDRDSRFALTRGIEPTGGQERRYAMLTGHALDPAHPFRTAIAAGKPASGLFLTELGPALLVVSPILDGSGGGESRGGVLMGRVLTDDVVASLARRAQVPLQMEALAMNRRSLSANFQAVITQHPEVTQISRTIADINGLPLLKLRMDLPRSISSRGRDAVQFAGWSLLLAGIGVLAVLFVLMRGLVLQPIADMKAFAADVAGGGELTHRLSVTRHDEVGQLARDLNLMVERLAEARREVADRSFEAGIAEMTRGVLHNIGNALTPVLVHVGTLQKKLGGLQTADLERASQELGRAGLDPGRQARLCEFLRLASSDLRNNVEQSAAVAADAVNGVLAIQAILHQQSQFARSALLLERIELPELVARSLRLIAPEKLGMLDIETDASLAAPRPLLLPRVALQQVVQNVVVNACEATGPGRRGRLRIAADLDERGPARQLSLTFVDDGVGIAPEDLPRVMSKGFSTKSRDTNSGLGLHWCANTIRSMGGNLQIESAGTGRGTTIRVILPVGEQNAAPRPRELAA